MALEILTVPCRSDNYAFVLNNPQTGETAIVDAPEAGPLLDAISAKGWTPSSVLITHHHSDHVEGLEGLKSAFDLKVIGAENDRARLPEMDIEVSEGDEIEVCGHKTQIFDVSGHTIGHIAFYMPEAEAVFTADSLMALGCGRVFEGTMDQMWESLSKLAALPENTLVYSGHEYTAAKVARFGRSHRLSGFCRDSLKKRQVLKAAQKKCSSVRWG